MLITLSTGMVFVGSSCVIAAMYVPVYTLAFVLAGGISTGVGTAGFFMLWQRYFSSIDAEASNYRLILGAAAACACYFALYLIPIALAAFLIPVVMLPICALCLSLSAREMDFDQPMFEDVPREHPQVYIQVIKDSEGRRPLRGRARFRKRTRTRRRGDQPADFGRREFRLNGGAPFGGRDSANALAHLVRPIRASHRLSRSLPDRHNGLVPISLHAENRPEPLRRTMIWPFRSSRSS